MGEFVPICPEATDVNVLLDFLVKTVKMRRPTVNLIRAQRVPCVKMNQALETIHVFVAVATQELIAI